MAHLIPFPKCPDFTVIFALAKEYYIIRTSDHSGGYSIVLDLAPNGKVNNSYK